MMNKLKLLHLELEEDQEKSFSLSNRTVTFIIVLFIFGTLTYHIDWTTPKYIPFQKPSENPYFLDQLEKKDNSSLINLKNFSYIIDSNKTCGDSFLLILVHSTPESHDRRIQIRSTWGGYEKTTLVFLMGTDRYPRNRSMLIEESRNYGDIVQGNFVESYRNLTYKHVMGLKWATYRCQEALYVLKIDEDMNIHTPNLIRYLNNTISPHGAYNLLMCSQKYRIINGMQFPAKNNPNSHCFGWSIVYSRNVVYKLYRLAQKTFYFWVDDLHITGTLASKLRISLTPIHKLTIFHEAAKIINGDKVVQDNHIFYYPFLKPHFLTYLPDDLECLEQARNDSIAKRHYNINCEGSRT